MIEQGTLEWFEARRGKVTASRIVDVMATVKSGEAAAVRNYRAQLVAERLTGQIAESYRNASIERGKELEAEARAAYAFFANANVIKTGFVQHPTIIMSGASPDGLVGDDGLVEIKCPNTATHIDTLLTKTVPRNYMLQMIWQMECTGRKWCDYVSYDNRLPDGMQLFISRQFFDDDLAQEVRERVQWFLGSVDKMVSDLQAIRN